MQAVTFIFAFVAVLALIGVAAWLVRRFASNRLGANTQRGRMPRLAVIDAAAVDGRRRLVLVRRDNIEHLLMIGGPSDIVVESNIVRATPAREQLPQRAPSVATPEPPAPRLAPLPDSNWNEPEPVRHDTFEYAEPPLPDLPPRPIRQPFPDEVRRPAAAERRIPDPDRRAVEQERRVVDPMAGFALEPLGRAEPRPDPMPPRMPPRNEPIPRGDAMLRSESAPRNEPMPRNELMPRGEPRAEPMMPRAPRQADAPKPPPPRAPERPAPLPPSADQSLAEMAQRLEAALRRPVAEAAVPPPVPESLPARPAAPRNESPPVVTAAPAPAPPSPPPPAPPAPPPNNAFDSLEDEMASLLGRSKSSSS